MLKFSRTMEAKLFEAICSGEDSLALCLIEGLEDVNVCQKGNASKTALRKAIKQGRLTIVKKLLEHGADVNPKDRSYPAVNFPLSLACARRNVEMIKLLLAYGADPFLRTTGDHTGQMCPFEVALAVRNTDSIRILLEQITALHERNRDLIIKGAIAAQEIDKLKTYLTSSSLVDDCSVECTASYLQEAVTLGNLRMVQLLLDRGANIDNLVPGSMRFDPIVSMHVDGPIEQPSGSTPLMQACRRRHVAIVEELLVRGADVNMTNSAGWTALQVTVAGINRTPACAQERNLQIVRLLIRNGAFVNPGDKLRLNVNKNLVPNKFSVERNLPGPLDRVLATICQFNLYSNPTLLRIASNLIKAGARPLIPTMQLLMELHANDPEAKNPDVCELARLMIRSLDPFGSVFYSQTVLWTGGATNMADLIRDSLRQSLTLHSLCSLKLRKEVLPPLMRNLQSDDIALPPLLKKNIIELK
ncbi:ankyrin repeat and KH domain-containing protein mask-like [Lineus longissimus]|uniref:ankyrin repeat and KH domain-containing protein mask-like n=1 Tax=Lineus longissimus TaxID=88925 RepID=UPI002B4CC9AC